MNSKKLVMFVLCVLLCICLAVPTFAQEPIARAPIHCYNSMGYTGYISTRIYTGGEFITTRPCPQNAGMRDKEYREYRYTDVSCSNCGLLDRSQVYIRNYIECGH